MNTSSFRLVGILLVAMSASASGLVPIIGRFAYDAGIDTFTLLFLRFSLSAVILGIPLIIRHTPVPTGKTLLMLIAMGSIGCVAGSYCYLSSIKYASAGLVALLYYLYPAFVAFLAVIFLREKLTRSKGFFLTLAILGAALTANPQGGQLIGILLAITGGFIYAIFVLVGAVVLKQISPLQSSTIIFASSGLVFGCLALFNGFHLPVTSTGWTTIAAITLFGGVIPTVTFLAGLKHLGPTDASMIAIIEPIVTILMAALLLNEQLQPIALLGGALVLIPVVFLTKDSLRKETAFSILP